MALDQTDVKKIAQLAQLAVSDQEADALVGELSVILDLVATMDSVDTSEVTPMAHPLHMSQRLRADEVTETNQRELFQEIAPLTQDGLYLVPRVIE